MNQQGTVLLDSASCRRCGQALGPGDAFCARCGEPAQMTAAVANPVNAQPTPAISQKQSGFGIASFILAIASSALIVISSILSVNYVLANGTTLSSLDRSLVIIGLLFLVGGAGLLFSIGLGIAGILQKTFKKTFAIIGLVLSSTVILLIAGLLVISRLINVA